MFDAVILAGGAARRLGGADKPAELVGAVSLLGHVISAVGGARRIVVVGPPRTFDRGATDVIWRREEPAGSGPVAAIGAGLSATCEPTVVVLAADLPDIAPAVSQLVNAVQAGAPLALLVDEDGRPNYLAGAWRRDALAAALRAIGDPIGVSMRALVAAAGDAAFVPDTGGWGRDCDTWDDLTQARQRHDRRHG